MVSQAGQIVVGRQREMKTLPAALNDALSRRGHVVMLGKTRIAAMMLANGMIPAARNAGDGAVKESKDRNAKAQRLQ